MPIGRGRLFALKITLVAQIGPSTRIPKCSNLSQTGGITAGTSYLDQAGRLKQALGKRKTPPNMRFSAFGNVMVWEAVSFDNGRTVAIASYCTVGGPFEAGVVYDSLQVRFPSATSSSFGAASRADGDTAPGAASEPMFLRTRESDSSDEEEAGAKNGASSAAYTRNACMRTNEARLIPAAGQLALVDEVEKIFKRVEPNLLMSYDLREGLGRVLNAGRALRVCWNIWPPIWLCFLQIGIR